MPRSSEKMPHPQLETSKTDLVTTDSIEMGGVKTALIGTALIKTDAIQEEARLSALAATGILDTEPEPSFDAITRLCAEYFRADTVLLSFGDASRVWIKSYWGEAVRELPRQRSVFEMVLVEDGPVVVPDVSEHPGFLGIGLRLRRLEVVSFASAPVR